MTLNGVMAVILSFSPNSVVLGADYIKVVENRPIQSTTKSSTKNLAFNDISFMTIFAEVTENQRIIERHLRDIHRCVDYDASEKSLYALGLIEIGPISTIMALM